MILVWRKGRQWSLTIYVTDEPHIAGLTSADDIRSLSRETFRELHASVQGCWMEKRKKKIRHPLRLLIWKMSELFAPCIVLKNNISLCLSKNIDMVRNDWWFPNKVAFAQRFTEAWKLVNNRTEAFKMSTQTIKINVTVLKNRSAMYCTSSMSN